MGSSLLFRYCFISSPISIQRLSAFDTTRLTEAYPPFTGDRVIPAESRFSRVGNRSTFGKNRTLQNNIKMRTIINRHILITGAGVAGPALAYWLQKYGFTVTVVEKASSLRRGGYRVDLRGKAVDVASRMGLLAAIQKNSTEMRGASLVNKKGRRVNWNDPNVWGLRQKDDVGILRGDLVDILYRATKDKVEYIFGDSIVGMVQTPGHVRVTFASGASRTFDLVVGADGLRSHTRQMVFGDDAGCVKDLGYFVSIFSIPNTFGLDRWELNYSSAGKVVNVYSKEAKERAKVCLLFSAPDQGYDHRDIQQQKRMVAEHFITEGWEVPWIVKGMERTPEFYFDSVSQVHLRRLYRGRIVLLGDAGYCPSPASGQGTSMALVGAFVLAGELALADGDHQLAFPGYERNMRGFIQKNQELAVKILKDMIPASAARVWFRSMFLRLLFLLPGKKWILRRLLKDVRQSVDEAANAIQWKAYPKIPSDAAYYTTSRPGMPWQTTTTALLQIADL